MNLGKVNEALDHRITGGSEYQWQCYGPNARFLEYESEYAHASVLFDSKTQVVYEASINDKNNDYKPYRWLNPNTKQEFLNESKTRKVNPYLAWDNTNWYELEVSDDWIEKARAMFNGERFDDRIQIPIDLDDDTMLLLCMEAHKRDITLNKMVEQILEVAIANKL